MSDRSSRKKKKDSDFAVTAFRVVQEATSGPETPQEPELTPEERHSAAVALGRLGGKKGGPARAAKLTPERRKEIAKHAAAMRWSTRDHA